MNNKARSRNLMSIEVIERNIVRLPWSGCWVWTAGTFTFGYGRIMVEGKRLSAHRLSWFLHNGPAKEGMDVLHRCGVAHCCNPDHLYLGTARENILDAVRHGTWRKKSEFCRKGHRRINGKRCSICSIAYGKQYRERRANGG